MNMMLDLNYIGYFLVVMEQQSFTAAAEQLNVPKSTISRRMNQLESQLGVRLFSRHANKVLPTSAAEQLALQYGPIFHQLEHLAAQQPRISQEPSGRLKLSIANELMHSELSFSLAQFAQRYPQIQLDVQLSERFQQLAIENYDAALIVKDGWLSDADYIAQTLFAVPSVLVCSPACWQSLSAAQQLQIEQLNFSNVNCLAHRGMSEWHFGQANNYQKANINSSRGQIQVNSIYGQMVFASQDLGIARLPQFFCQSLLDSQELIVINTVQPCLPFEICLVYKERQLQALNIQLFIEFYQQHKFALADKIAALSA